MSATLSSRRLAALIGWTAMVFPASAAGPVFLIVGPPGSGRTTQAQLLSKELGMPIIAADDLIARNSGKFQKSRIPALHGVDPRLDPLLNSLVEEALVGADLSKGVLLDGYPAAKIQADFLQTLRRKFDMPRAIVIHLSAPDDVVRKRLKGQKRDIEQELKDYHREFDFIREYFPEADIRTVDGTKKPAAVAKQILKALAEAPK